MRKIYLLSAMLFACTFITAQNNGGRLLDWPMKMNQLSIKVAADAFTATTFMEMEFCNPNDKEIEGLYRFELEPGQAITSFQLDLNGKFRDGTIEEKWKARNAYNTIVGKRVDPALLQMEYANHYSLNIYPIPAKGCRRITMTVQQLLKPSGGKLMYRLPFRCLDTLQRVEVSVKSGGSTGSPVVSGGLLANQAFIKNGSNYELNRKVNKMPVNGHFSFSIPLSLEKPSLCIKQAKEQNFFALRFIPGVKREYEFSPGKVVVFWDVSASGKDRDINKEIEFLNRYIAGNNISQLRIITFNQQVQDTVLFMLDNGFNRWRGYLQALKYDGATRYGCLDFSSVHDDAILLFSDGKNSFGKSLPVPGMVHTWCISSSQNSDSVHLEKIIGFTGGRYVNLKGTDIDKALPLLRTTENVLFRVKAGDTEIMLNEKLCNVKEDTVFLTGTIPAGVKSLSLQYGNNGKAREEELLDLLPGGLCEVSAIDRIEMLNSFEQYIKQNVYWYDLLHFGKKEKVVTTSTSYIVLERIEDYIRFNIAPPADLQAECDMNMFVKADEEKNRQYRYQNDFGVLQAVASAYNERIREYDKSEKPILLTEDSKWIEQPFKAIDARQTGSGVTVANGLTGTVSGIIVTGESNAPSMSEVVVTAFGVSRKSMTLGYSVSRVTANDLNQGQPVNLQNGLTGKVSGLNIQSVNNGVFGDTRITLRGIRSLTGNNQPLLVVDGMPVALNFLNSINPKDITDVTVLKSASSTAIYGADGVNGAIVVTTKKGSRYGYGYHYWSAYRLKDMPDVDYLKELKETATASLSIRYDELRNEYKGDASFYIDAAQVFYDAGMSKEAINILYSAADASNGNRSVVEAIACFLESWKEYDEAIRVYEGLLDTHPDELSYYRGLALAYYQKRDYRNTVKNYYAGIARNAEGTEYLKKHFKAMMLQEMNAVIAAHKDSADISGINPQLIRPLHYDLRITLDCNSRNIARNVTITEPGGKKCSYDNSQQNAEGRLTAMDYYADYYGSIEEYQVKNAKAGKYKISVNSYEYYSSPIPYIIRIVIFRNTANGPVLEVKNAMMDNQYGHVEIADIRW